MNRSGKNDELTGPEAHAQRRQVVENQCNYCRHSVDAGYAIGELAGLRPEPAPAARQGLQRLRGRSGEEGVGMNPSIGPRPWEATDGD